MAEYDLTQVRAGTRRTVPSSPFADVFLAALLSQRVVPFLDRHLAIPYVGHLNSVEPSVLRFFLPDGGPLGALLELRRSGC